jgi:hypothetical protein
VDGTVLVKDCLIDDCKSGVNVQHASGAGVTVTNSEINVVAQGAGNDTYCVRFGSKSGLAQSLNIAGGVFTVDRNGLTPDAGTYFNAVIVRAAAFGHAGPLAVEHPGRGGQPVRNAAHGREQLVRRARPGRRARLQIAGGTRRRGDR